ESRQSEALSPRHRGNCRPPLTTCQPRGFEWDIGTGFKVKQSYYYSERKAGSFNRDRSVWKSLTTLSIRISTVSSSSPQIPIARNGIFRSNNLNVVYSDALLLP